MKIIPALLTAAVLACPVAAAQHEGVGQGGSHELHEHMLKSSEEMKTMEMSGDLDRDFVQSMLTHHRHGVEMAQIQLENGKDAKAKEFARKVVQNQKKEIKELERWLEQHPEPGQTR
ncbi:MAG TPA: DUF305 domain-containing protein [Candidatus Thermoplasmatota archaeon]|nr:DUF305 domain-containing protein [Candidatus Thermoplasmatota archaeon]